MSKKLFLQLLVVSALMGTLIEATTFTVNPDGSTTLSGPPSRNANGTINPNTRTIPAPNVTVTLNSSTKTGITNNMSSYYYAVDSNKNIIPLPGNTFTQINTGIYRIYYSYSNALTPSPISQATITLNPRQIATIS